jgi:hypothetical protein
VKRPAGARPRILGRASAGGALGRAPAGGPPGRSAAGRPPLAAWAPFALLALLAPAARAAADLPPPQRQLEYRAGLAGGTSDLRVAAQLGASLDRRFALWTVGLGLELLRGGTLQGQEVWGLSWGAHGRRSLLSSRWRPFAEGGVGVYMFDIRTSPEPGAPRSFAGAGASLGAGLEVQITAENSLRLGAARHVTRLGREARGHYLALVGLAFHPASP